MLLYVRVASDFIYMRAGPDHIARVRRCSSLVHSLVPWAGNDVFRHQVSQNTIPYSFAEGENLFAQILAQISETELLIVLPLLYKTIHVDALTLT